MCLSLARWSVYILLEQWFIYFRKPNCSECLLKTQSKPIVSSASGGSGLGKRLRNIRPLGGSECLFHYWQPWCILAYHLLRETCWFLQSRLVSAACLRLSLRLEGKYQGGTELGTQQETYGGLLNDLMRLLHCTGSLASWKQHSYDSSMPDLFFKDPDNLKHYPTGTVTVSVTWARGGWRRGGVSRKLVCPPWAHFPELPFKSSHFVEALIRELNWY